MWLNTLDSTLHGLGTSSVSNDAYACSQDSKCQEGPGPSVSLFLGPLNKVAFPSSCQTSLFSFFKIKLKLGGGAT